MRSGLKEASIAGSYPLWHFTVAGRHRFDSSSLRWTAVSHETADAFGLLRHAHDLKGDGVVILEDTLMALRDEGGDPRMRMLLADMLSNSRDAGGMVLVFLDAPEGAGRLPGMLADQFVRFDVAYPRAGELESIVKAKRRSFALLRPTADAASQERVRDLILAAYAETEATAVAASA